MKTKTKLLLAGALTSGSAITANAQESSGGVDFSAVTAQLTDQAAGYITVAVAAIAAVALVPLAIKGSRALIRIVSGLFGG